MLMLRWTLTLLLLVSTLAGRLSAGDWISEPSYYTHGPDGQRVRQHTQIGPLYVYVDPSYQKSGYRHTRSSLQVGGSVDHYHSVEEWGRPVRPYDEWRFPYRPYSVPYQAWGPPYAGLGVFPGFPFSPVPFGGFGVPGIPGLGGGGGPGLPFPPGATRGLPPYFDDRYPQ